MRPLLCTYRHNFAEPTCRSYVRPDPKPHPSHSDGCRATRDLPNLRGLLVQEVDMSMRTVYPGTGCTRLSMPDLAKVEKAVTPSIRAGYLIVPLL